MAGLFLLGLFALFFSVNALSKRGQTEIRTLEATMMAVKIEKLKNLVELVHHAIASVNQFRELSQAQRQPG